MNPYALTGTAPSRRRVYLFHHLGSTDYLSDLPEDRASTKPGLSAGPCIYHTTVGWPFERAGRRELLAQFAEVYDIERWLEVGVGDALLGLNGLKLAAARSSAEV